jgi:hypothetical protein
VERAAGFCTGSDVVDQGRSVVDKGLSHLWVCRVGERNTWGNHMEELGESVVEIGDRLVIWIHLTQVKHIQNQEEP